jgi:uncharacterized membrane protein YvlD (DUF360 family)
MSQDSQILRTPALRPSARQVIRRLIATTLVLAAALVVSSWLLGDFDIDRARDALLAGLVIGLVNALIWPALAVVLVPLSVFTLGLASLVVNAAMIWFVLDELPGVQLDGFGAALMVTIVMTAAETLLGSALALDDDSWYDQRMARRARRRRTTTISDVPGVVFAQIDGLGEAVLRIALASGDVPTLRRWIDDGGHRLSPWQTEWSSQTGVSQCGILHGSTSEMPAFRWVDKATGDLVVSNHPKSALAIEQRHSDGNGLLARNGSSYGNLYTGDAERAVLTMSVAGRVKEGRLGAGYRQYFSRPSNVVRTFNSTVVEVVRERHAARDQIRRGVQPRVSRNWTYAFLRAFTTIVSRDVCVEGVLNDMAEGRDSIYIDFLGYDEVSHHSGPLREDTLRVLRDIDRQIARFERATAYAPRPYRIVVLSDHGQTQGSTFEDRYGESLAALVARLCGSAVEVDSDSETGRTESSAWLRTARSDTRELQHSDTAPTVLASGNLGLVYLPIGDRRLTLEEIDEHHRDLVPGLVAHPGIGFVLVQTASDGPVVLGANGRRLIDSGKVEGDDPLGPFGVTAVDLVSRAARYSTAGDLMVNSMYDAERDEVAAFEHQVSSHGGLGGPQTHPFVLYPSELTAPSAVIDGPSELHRVLKGWMRELGQSPAGEPSHRDADGRRQDPAQRAQEDRAPTCE